MTEISFHFNVPDKLAYACRLLRKAVNAGNKVVVASCTAAGWNAVATNASIKGAIATCGIYVGSGAPPDPAVVTEGAPACY